MKKILRGLVGGVLLCGSAAWAYDDGDWQLFLKAEAGGKTECGWEPKVEQELRYGDDMSEYYYTETYLSLGYKVTDWFKPVLGFAQIYERVNTARYQASGEEYSQKSDYYWK